MTSEIRPDWDLSAPGLREAWNAGDLSRFHGWEQGGQYGGCLDCTEEIAHPPTSIISRYRTVGRRLLQNGIRTLTPAEYVSGAGDSRGRSRCFPTSSLWLNASVKIAIDIRRMTEFGVGTYIRNVVRTLGRLDYETTYFLIGSPAKVKEIGPLPPNFHTVPLAEPERSLKSYREFRAVVKRLESTWCTSPICFRATGPASPLRDDSARHAGAFVACARANRILGTCHFQRTKRVLSGAARIFAVSNFTKIEIEKLFDIPPGASRWFTTQSTREPSRPRNPADRQLIAERYQVTYPFLLYAGRISPHKNVVRMIEAFSALKTELEKDQMYPDLKLIIIGDDVSGNPDLRRTVIRSGVQNDVRFLGFVPIEVLRTFYDAAKIFVFPSLYEGFGVLPWRRWPMAHRS